jgi:hypothetical protein
MVDGKIPFSILFLSESQSRMDGDGKIHTYACKYKVSQSTIDIFSLLQQLGKHICWHWFPVVD